MKKIIFLIAVVITATTVAQQGINYKALIKDNLGNVLVNQTIDVKFTIIADTEPTDVYTETHTGVVTDANGIIVLSIGEGTTIDVFTAIIWSDDTHSLKTEIDTAQDGTFEFMSTTQFMAVPYALSAANAATKIDELSDGKSDNDGTNNGSSLFLGIDAGASDDATNNKNVGVGYQALTSNTLGGSNTANGYQALSSNTTGSSNMANGRSALSSNTTGNFNTANGAFTLSSNTEGNGNTANGFWSLFSNTTGSINTANGYSALYSNTIGSNNTATGTQALYSNTEGYNNTATGTQALYLNTEGSNNTANGNEALFSNIYGSNNTATGYRALYNNVGDEFFFSAEGSNNTANGYQALFENIEGSNNTANGYQALANNTTGNNNVANGFRALANNIAGNNNTATGYKALFSNVGDGDFLNPTGINNTAIGYEALYSNVGSQNTANGYRALFSNTTGESNTANGYYALFDNTTGDYNTAIGIYALSDNTTGGYNTAIGRSALATNISGSFNVALGYRAGFNETGSNKLYIAGSSTNPLIYGDFDAEILEINGATTVKSSVNANPDLILGGTANTTAGDDGIIASDPTYAGSDIFIRSNDAVVVQLDYDNNETGQFEIKDGNQVEVFEVDENGTVRQNGTTIHSSDRRLKKDIEDLPYGLKEILQLQPKAYNWKNRTEQHKSLGLIAQEVQPIIKEIVTTKDDAAKTLGISYTELIPILINAIKEQQQLIETQNLKISDMSAELQNTKDLELRIKQIESILKTPKQ